MSTQNINNLVELFLINYKKQKKDKNFIYGAGTSTSPDLQLAKEKAQLIAKAEIADILHGEMNEKTKKFKI